MQSYLELMTNSQPRRRRLRQTDQVTQPIPFETLAEMAVAWRARQLNPNPETK